MRRLDADELARVKQRIDVLVGEGRHIPAMELRRVHEQRAGTCTARFYDYLMGGGTGQNPAPPNGPGE
jgi:hypothetical protein